MLKAHLNKITSLKFQNKEKVLASGDNTGLVLMWYPTMSEEFIAGATLKSEVTKLSWSPDDSQLAVGTKDGEIVILEAPV